MTVIDGSTGSTQNPVFLRVAVNRGLNMLDFLTSREFIFVSVFVLWPKFGQTTLEKLKMFRWRTFWGRVNPSSDAAVGNQIRNRYTTTLRTFEIFFAIFFTIITFVATMHKELSHTFDFACHQPCLKKCWLRDTGRQPGTALIRRPVEERQAAIGIGEESVSRDSLVERKVRPERNDCSLGDAVG